MENIQGNRFRCSVGETVTLTFIPSHDDILRVLYKERLNDDLRDVGDDFVLTRTIGASQVNIEVVFVFFPNADGSCRIILSGSQGGEFENTPSATDQPFLPEHRTYRFIPQ